MRDAEKLWGARRDGFGGNALTAAIRGARPLDPRELVRRLGVLAGTKAAASRAGDAGANASTAARDPWLTAASTLPRVRINAAGATYSGAVLGCEEHAGGLFVLLAARDADAKPGSSALSYLDLRPPFSITVEDADAWPAIFRGGDVLRWSSDPSLGAAETKRALQDASAKLGEMKITLDVEPQLIANFAARDANNVLRDLVGELVTYMTALDRDPSGRAARDSIATIEIRRDPGLFAIARDGATLRVRLDPDRGLPERSDFTGDVDRAV